MAIWHSDPALNGRFHPEFPNDVQVLVHEGSFRFTHARPEVMWARISDRVMIKGAQGRRIGAYRAMLLNQPFELQTLHQQDEILLVGHAHYPYSIRVSELYLTERTDYDILPCNQCGLPELFDRISVLTATTFPDTPSDQHLMMFTSACPLCSGLLVVRHKDFDRQP